MFSALRPDAHRYQRAAERLFALALVGTALAALVFTLLFLLRHTFAHGVALWLLGTAYLGVRAAQAHAAYRRAEAGALETRLLLQPLDAATLHACLYRHDHLWARSRVLDALRRGLALPPLGRLRADEHARRLYHLFAAELAPLRPSLLRPNLVLLTGLFALWATQVEPGSAQLGYAVGCTVLLGLVELGELRLAWQAQTAADALVAGLSYWALEHGNAAWHTSTPRPYTHERLYLDIALTPGGMGVPGP